MRFGSLYPLFDRTSESQNSPSGIYSLTDFFNNRRVGKKIENFTSSFNWIFSADIPSIAALLWQRCLDNHQRSATYCPPVNNGLKGLSEMLKCQPSIIWLICAICCPIGRRFSNVSNQRPGSHLFTASIMLKTLSKCLLLGLKCWSVVWIFRL